MTTSSAGGADDAYWRRPADGGADGADPGDPATPRRDPPRLGSPSTQPAPEPPLYSGPPPTQPPPPGWRTPRLVRPAPPRELPEQDIAALDVAERGARTLTLGIGMIAGAIVLILSCLLCSRFLF